jgi:hypothetical protein
VILTEARKLATKRKRIMSDSEEDMPCCDDCGQVFATLHDLQKHVKLRCPEGTIEEPSTKKVKADLVMSDLTDIAKNATFQFLNYKTKDHNKTQWINKFGKHVGKDQMDEARATRKADEKIKPEDKREFFRGYTHLLKLIKCLHACYVHKHIVYDMMILHCKGYKKASPNVLLPYIHLFDELFDLTFPTKKATPPRTKWNTTKKATHPKKKCMNCRATPSLVMNKRFVRGGLCIKLIFIV